MKNKTCSRCGVAKDASEFYLRKNRRNGLSSQCKQCKRNYSRSKYVKHPVLNKILSDSFKKCSECMETKNINEFYIRKDRRMGFTSRCKECYRKSWKDAYSNNREEILRKNKITSKERRKKINEWHRIYFAKRIKTDIQFRLRHIVRRRARGAMCGKVKPLSAVKALGCSIEYFRKYMEEKFIPGMGWDNYGHGDDKWNIDHIKPLCNFDLTNKEQFLKACNYKNQQPMWQVDNFKKGRKNVRGFLVKSRKAVFC